MQEKYSKILVLGVLVLIAGLVGGYVYWLRTTPPPFIETPAGQALLGGQDAVYTGIDGNALSLESYVGQPLYINTWASWSPLSAQELLDLNEVAGEFKDKGLTVIALNRKETKEQAARFLASLQDLPNITIVIDTTDHFYDAVDGYAMPETIIFDKAGVKWKHERSVQSKEQMRQLMTEAIAERE